MRTWLIVSALLSVIPARADSQFRVRQVARTDVPRGKGQCDIRLQVDNEVEVSVRGDMVFVRTLSGQDARDDGSECSAPLPRHEIPDLVFQVKEKRNEIRLAAPPDGRNDFAAIVRIRDSAEGFGRYHFRLLWNLDPVGGLVLNNVISFRGRGGGTAAMNDSDSRRLLDVNVDIDRGGKLLVSFRADRGPAVLFTGFLMSREGDRLKASVTSEDGRLRGPMYIVVDDRQDVNSISLEATDGRDRLRVNWLRR